MAAAAVTVAADAEVKVPADCREVGHLAVWSVTSAKPGNGVELLRDGKTDTYWQSDGTQPHLVNIQFQRKVHLQELQVHLDYKVDESYTPSKLAIRVGSSYHDLKEIKVVELEEPVGWVRIPLKMEGSNEVLKAFFVQIGVLANHQNGRDTHIREIQIYGPRRDAVKALGFPLKITTTEFNQYMAVR